MTNSIESKVERLEAATIRGPIEPLIVYIVGRGDVWTDEDYERAAERALQQEPGQSVYIVAMGVQSEH